MSLKKKLQALVKIAKGGSFGVKFTSDGFAHATDNAMVLTTEVGHACNARECIADAESLSTQVKGMTKDTAFFEMKLAPYNEGGESDFDPGLNAVTHDAAQFVDVDPFVIKRLFDAVTQCWEGKKTDAIVRLSYYHGAKIVSVRSHDGSVLAVAKPVVKL